jgi:hypothetical protein
LNIDYLKHQISLLSIKAPFAGIVEVSLPDEWRGKSIKIGEKIMTLSNPEKTKVKIWIAERDNVGFSNGENVSIILNTMPHRTYNAHLAFIAPVVRVEENQIPSFIAEAYWEEPEKAPQLGLKGSAILYGETVSLFYYFFRKPLLTLRKFVGI